MSESVTSDPRPDQVRKRLLTKHEEFSSRTAVCLVDVLNECLGTLAALAERCTIMEQALAKIRVHTSSSLAHQKTPASLLVALESTLKEQKTEPSPTAYFAALLTTLDGTIQKKEFSLNEGDILPAELYLIALVIPFVSVPVIRANLSTLLALTAPLFPQLLGHAPALKSQVSLYQVILLSIDRAQLETHGIRQAFASILQLCLDPRPKVRKKAVEVVRDILSKPPLPLVKHPYAERVAEWIRSALTDVGNTAFQPKASKGVENSQSDTAIHILAFLRPVISKLPSSSYPPITSLLLALPRLGNTYVSQSSYAVLSELFALSREDTDSGIDTSVLPGVLKTVMTFLPSKNDSTLAPAWVHTLGNIMLAYSHTDRKTCAVQLGAVWKTVWSFLESDAITVRRSTAESLNMLLNAVVQSDASSKLPDIIAQISKAFNSVTYTRAIPELLLVTSALIDNIQGKPFEDVRERLLSLITYIGNLRTEKGFEYKEVVDNTLSTAMRVLGPEIILEILPLNLEPSDRQAGREPRAFLLPLLAHPHPSPLSHFVSYFVPLSERMFDLQQKAESEGRQSEAKVWSVLVAQVWAGFPAYCHGSVNIDQTLNASFSQLISQLLYGQPELRPAVLRGLKTIVESNIAIASSSDETINPSNITPEQAAQNVVFLRTQAESWLAVLFNVFGSVNRDARGAVGEVITAWAGVAAEPEVAKVYRKVVDLLNANIARVSGASANSGSENIAVTALDLLLLLLPHLSVADMTALFRLCLSPTVLTVKDNGIQKRGYKILTRLVESGKIPIDAAAVFQNLETLSDNLTAAAKKDRYNLQAALVPKIPSSALHLIPSLIPEAVLGTKETSDKARAASFDFIVAMGKKMSEGGVVKRDMLDGMDEDTTMEATATVEEFITMVAGGLAGTTPHMISATITALSRLVFEFNSDLSNTMRSEVFTTLLVFLSSANREIVKSVLGFIKLAIHTYPVDIIQPHLKEVVPALLGWSHDHKNHFKSKVRHIFERLLRRFSWEEVYASAGDEEAAKVLVNIKKRKERAKRKKANRVEEGLDMPAAQSTTGDAFEDVIYGSESELDESDEDDETIDRSHPRPNRQKGVQGIRLRVDGDEPMDLLQGVASRITNASSTRRRKPGQDAAHYKTDEETGKMVIDDSDDSDGVAPEQAAQDVSGTAYRESMTSVDGFIRGANGRVKFNKNTKKRRRENEEQDEMDVDEKTSGKDKRRTSAKLGQEFKAKRAGGDVKKGGMDPYAYMSLSQAAKKSGRGGKTRIGIVGRE